MARNLKVLRAQVKARQQAAQRKIRRLTDQKGVQIAGTRYDPRKDAKVIDRLTGAQLDAQLARLNIFIDRKTQFVAGAHGVPMTKKQWDRTANAQARANAAKKKLKDKFKDVFVPESGSTIGQREATIDADRKLAGNPAVQKPWTPTNYQPRNVTSDKALKKLEKQLMKQTSMTYQQQAYKNARKQARQIMSVVKDVNLERKLKKLTPDQFMALWFGSPFATAFSIIYEIAQALLDKEERAFHEDQLADSRGEAHRLTDWASGLKFDK